MHICRKNIKQEEQKYSLDTLLEIGSKLKKVRETKSLTLKDINKVTCIPLHHLLAIEEGYTEELPEPIFLKGFIRKYAKVLEVNLESLIDRYFFEFNWRQRKLVKQEKKNKQSSGSLDMPLFKVYHFYLLIACVIFIMCASLIFLNNSTMLLEESHSTFNLF